ncbi:type IV secretory system conjugative DNA transfer family protein [Massilioclostridium coli]|uniref:type IV secretory system conjugative DNA transfer family protein n=1 Tax=Massilioclostridium coli TaxID=1870991 RepID=UPI00085BB538|nr:type IV secretion system DNA-binding domain-containing protein [Massilioclostridium coli]
MDVPQFLQEFDKYRTVIFISVITLPLIFIVLEVRKSVMISRFFNFWKSLKQASSTPKIPPEVTKTQDGTLIGFKNNKPVFIADNCRHVFVCGTTGSGKTVALSNFIKRGIDKNYPMLIVDGKGDTGNGSILEITKQLCKKQNLYIVSLSNPDTSTRYNPFKNASPTMCKDMLINMTDWSEEHYKLNTERYLQRLIILLQQNQIPLSFQTIIQHMSIDNFKDLSSTLLKQEIISKQEHLLNLETAKTSGDIAQSAAARFSTILESDFGSIFDENGIDIYTAIQENAVILFILNPLLYPEISPLFGRLLLIDAKQAINKCFKNRIERAFYLFDEINSYASPTLIDLVNKSRSANITSILATQSLSDLDFAVNQAFKEQIIENTNNYIVLRQNSAVNAENWANILGTKSTLDVTYQLKQNSSFSSSETGLGSARRVRTYYYHPDDIKTLPTGKAVFLSKDKNFHTLINVNKPF